MELRSCTESRAWRARARRLAPCAAALVIAAGCAPAPDARGLLLEATDAIRSLRTVQYRFVYEGSGSLGGTYAGDVVLVPRADRPPLYRAELRPSPLAPRDTSWERGAPTLELAAGADDVAARDGVLERFSYGTVSGGSGHLVAAAPHAVLFQLAERDPFEAELAGQPALVGRDTIGGVPCDVVRATNARFGGADVWWFLGTDDRLPRALRWVENREGVEGEFTLRIFELVVDAPIPEPRLSIAQQPGDEVVNEDARPVAPGAPAPDWELSAPHGRRLRLSELRGRPAVIAFWSTWCLRCRELVAELDRLHGTTPGLRLLAINAWEGEGTSPAEIVEGAAIDVELLLEGERAAWDYKVGVPPALFLVDGSGDLAWVRNPVSDPAAAVDELARALSDSLAGG